MNIYQSIGRWEAMKAAVMAYDPTAESTRPILAANPQKPAAVAPAAPGADRMQIDRLTAIFDDRSEKQQLAEHWPKPANLGQSRLQAVYSGVAA